jgi:DNA ligase 4
VEDVDEILHEIASACRFSSPAVRGTSSGLRLAERETDLGDIYKRLSGRDAKWLTRLILKNFEPVIFDPQLIYRSYHPFLPAIIKVQDDLAVAGRVLANVQRNRTGKADLAEFLKPALGVKIGRQPWLKGRSIKHCLDMSHGRMSCEDKLDGEYCQIHIDLSKGKNCIQIFSKSGKDSTMDRIALHEYVSRSNPQKGGGSVFTLISS